MAKINVITDYQSDEFIGILRQLYKSMDWKISEKIDISDRSSDILIICGSSIDNTKYIKGLLNANIYKCVVLYAGNEFIELKKELEGKDFFVIQKYNSCMDNVRDVRLIIDYIFNI